MSVELANLLAKNFIARRDVKAIQFSNGAWSPHQEYNPETRKHDGARIPWSRPDLEAHITAEKTFGHYLLDTDSTCKLFAFDIDLEKAGWMEDNLEVAGWLPNWPTAEDPYSGPFGEVKDLRSAWLDRKNPNRPFMKLQFKQIAHMLMRAIHEELELPCAAAYSGGKGIHVYAFTGKIPAVEAREGAQIVLDSLDCFKATRGTNFFKHKDEDPESGYPNLSIEVFPKQGSLDGKDLGNLMRLPLGRNLKSKDPTFFIDMTSPLGQMVPADPIWALTTNDPWKRPA